MDYKINITSPMDTTNKTTPSITIYIVSRCFRLFLYQPSRATKKKKFDVLRSWCTERT